MANERVTNTNTPGEILWTLGDHLGSVRTLMNQHGVIRKEIDYDAFGNVSSESHFDASGATISANNVNAVDQLFRFTDRYTDEDTGLQNNLHRWYDPKIGRWLSQDPIGFAGGDVNLYRYVGNDSTGKRDPSGLYDGYWSEVGQVFQGYGDAAVGTLQGGYFVLRHPLKASYGVGQAALHPKQTFHVICGDVKEKLGTTRGQGALVGDVLIGVATGGALKAASKTGTFGRFGGRFGSKLDELADAEKAAGLVPTWGTLDDVAACRWYHQQLDSIPSTVDPSLSLRERAIQAFKLRNQAKIDARRLMSDCAKAAELDITDPVPTIQDVVRKVYKEQGLAGDALWQEILESSMRSRPSVDKALGWPR